MLACGTQTVAVEKTPMDPVETRPQGPALDGDLLAWLESSKGSVQLPVDVRRSVLGIEGGTILRAQLDVRLDDTRLGIGLTDQLRTACGDEGPCVVWLEGEWGPTLPDPVDEPQPTLSVQKLIGVVEGEPTHARLP